MKNADISAHSPKQIPSDKMELPNLKEGDYTMKEKFIAPVIEEYKSGKITYAEAEFDARVKIYQSVNPNFNPDVEYMKDTIYRDIPSVDNSLFILARKLILSI